MRWAGGPGAVLLVGWAAADGGDAASASGEGSDDAGSLARFLLIVIASVGGFLLILVACGCLVWHMLGRVTREQTSQVEAALQDNLLLQKTATDSCVYAIPAAGDERITRSCSILSERLEVPPGGNPLRPILSSLRSTPVPSDAFSVEVSDYSESPSAFPQPDSISFSSSPLPLVLSVSAPGWQGLPIDGEYELIAQQQKAGMPLWACMPLNAFVLSEKAGRWTIVRLVEREGKKVKELVLKSGERHFRRKYPHECAETWKDAQAAEQAVKMKVAAAAPHRPAGFPSTPSAEAQRQQAHRKSVSFMECDLAHSGGDPSQVNARLYKARASVDLEALCTNWNSPSDDTFDHLRHLSSPSTPGFVSGSFPMGSQTGVSPVLPMACGQSPRNARYSRSTPNGFTSPTSPYTVCTSPTPSVVDAANHALGSAGSPGGRRRRSTTVTASSSPTGRRLRSATCCGLSDEDPAGRQGFDDAADETPVSPTPSGPRFPGSPKALSPKPRRGSRPDQLSRVASPDTSFEDMGSEPGVPSALSPKPSLLPPRTPIGPVSPRTPGVGSPRTPGKRTSFALPGPSYC
ncbi:hypothetical protein DIPPA_09014 [Diplonema papillatum]|nr:hypothetical protein DIPPA_09014 [Diplonema papillatum]